MSSGARTRQPGGFLCVFAMLAVLAVQLPSTFRTFDGAVRDNSWRTPEQRLIHTGEVLGVPSDFQEAALTFIPPGATFGIISPDPKLVAKAGVSSITTVGIYAYMQYLLLPQREVDPSEAQWLLCFQCNTKQWDASVTWTWNDDSGLLIGKAKGS